MIQLSRKIIGVEEILEMELLLRLWMRGLVANCRTFAEAHRGRSKPAPLQGKCNNDGPVSVPPLRVR